MTLSELAKCGSAQIRRVKFLLSGVVLAAAFFALAPSASAASLTWTFVDAATSRGATPSFDYTISGSYDYDVDTNTFANVAVTLSGTGAFVGTYTAVKSAVPVPADADSLWFVDSTDSDYSSDKAIRFNLVSAMTSAGGSIDLLQYLSLTCLASDCNSSVPSGENSVTLDGVIGGYVTTDLAPVPVPAALPLFGAGLAGLGWVARRRRHNVT